MLKSFSLFLLCLLLACLSACGPVTALIAGPSQTPVPSLTPTPSLTATTTFTPTPTLTPTITPTPTPQTLTIDQVLQSCEQLAQDGREVWVSGKIFLPKWKIIGYTGYKGLNLNEHLDEDQRSIMLVMEVGAGPQTMNPLPPYFTERDLVVRAENGQEIRHGHSVKVLGVPKYKQDSRRCELWPSRVESLMSAQVFIPVEEKIGSLTTNKCSLLSTDKQFVSLTGSISNWGAATSSCTLGICLLQFNDGSGKMRVTFVQGDQPSSLFISPENKASLIDALGNPLSLQEKLILTGVLYAELEGCTLSVYLIEKQ